MNLTPNIISSSNDITVQALWAFTNMSAIIFIILCMITITNILLGDYIIAKFQLETKYPKLHRIFKYRNTVKSYSLTLNIILIYLALILLFFYNLFFAYIYNISYKILTIYLSIFNNKYIYI